LANFKAKYLLQEILRWMAHSTGSVQAGLFNIAANRVALNDTNKCSSPIKKWNANLPVLSKMALLISIKKWNWTNLL